MQCMDKLFHPQDSLDVRGVGTQNIILIFLQLKKKFLSYCTPKLILILVICFIRLLKQDRQVGLLLFRLKAIQQNVLYALSRTYVGASAEPVKQT